MRIKKKILYTNGWPTVSGTYTEWLKKLLFGLKEYIYLRTARVDEIPIDTYHMERSFGMTKYRKILLAFPDNFNGVKLRDEDNEKLELIIKEFGLKAGRMKFGFDLPLKAKGLRVVISHWSLVIGHWALVSSHWLLGIGY